MSRISYVLRPTGMLIRSSLLRWFAAILVSGFALLLEFGPAALAQTAPVPSAQEIIERMDAAVAMREDAVLSYTVHEHYMLYRNGDATPAAEMTMQVDYRRGVGKRFTTLSQSGSALLRAAVLEKIHASEVEMSQNPVRGTVLVNSNNYIFTPQPGKFQINGRYCYLVTLAARRKSPHLFNGRAWVDAQDFFVVRLEGTPSQSVSFFAGDTTVARDYNQIEGFPMAVHAEAHSHSFLLGDSLLKIDSTDYRIEHTTTNSTASQEETAAPRHPY